MEDVWMGQSIVKAISDIWRKASLMPCSEKPEWKAGRPRGVSLPIYAELAKTDRGGI